MKRRKFLQGLGVLPALSILQTNSMAVFVSAKQVIPLDKPHDAWRGIVSVEAYQVLFEEETEAPGSSALNREHREGAYICAACYLPLFESQHKYESGTGWPSFTQPIADHIGTRRDYKLIWPRTEYHCARCGGHQGHVFNYGPLPRKQRWCNNGLALQVVPSENVLPQLRGEGECTYEYFIQSDLCEML